MFEKQILVAGVGNAWLQDDAFGGECARRLEARGVPSGVTVMDFGTGGLDLAYEVMRGYDALVLLDASRQGHEPGTLYVLEPEMAEFEGAIEDGDVINPHSMDPASMLRFVSAIGGFSGKVVIIGCEPGEVDDVGLGLTPPVEAAVERALALVGQTLEELRGDAAYSGLMHEFSIASAVVDTAVRHAAGRPVTAVTIRAGFLRQVVPDALEFAFGIVSRETLCEGARLELEVVPARLRCRACEEVSAIDMPVFRCAACASAEVDVLSGEELEVESIEVSQEEASCTA